MNKLLIFLFFGSVFSFSSLSLDEQQNYIESCTPQWKESRNFENPYNLFPEEMSAIYGYTYSDFMPINKHIYNKAELSDCYQEQVKLIDQGLAKIPDYKGIVFRGSKSSYYPFI